MNSCFDSFSDLPGVHAPTGSTLYRRVGVESYMDAKRPIMAPMTRSRSDAESGVPADLPERFGRAAGLNTPDPATFYTPGPKGYIDYPAPEPQAAYEIMLTRRIPSRYIDYPALEPQGA